MEIISTRKASVIDAIKAIIYGESGAGKTFLATTLRDVLFINAESGTMTLRNHDIDCINVFTVQDLRDVLKFIQDPAILGKYATIVVDSLSEISELFFHDSMRTLKDGRQAYPDCYNRVINFVRAFKALPQVNVVFLAKQAPVTDMDVTKYGPSMYYNKISNELPYQSDFVFRLFIRKNSDGTLERFFQTRYTDKDFQFVAKDRSFDSKNPILAEYEPANLQGIFDKISGNLTTKQEV